MNNISYKQICPQSIYKIKNVNVFLALLFICLSGTPINSFAQSQNGDSTNVSQTISEIHPPFIRVSAGFGASTMTFAGIASITYDLGNIFFGLRADEVFDASDMREDIRADEYAIIFGMSMNYQLGHLGFGTGISNVKDFSPGTPITFGGSHIVRYEKIEHSTIGLPIHFEAFFTPVRFFGIGVILFANINSSQSFGGFCLCIQFGKLN